MTTIKSFWWMTLITMLILAGCGSQQAAPTPTTAPPTPSPLKTPSPQAAPSPETSPSPTPGEMLPPSTPDWTETLQNVARSVAFIYTPTKMGSGFLIEGGYVVTNAHVVWPYDAVDVIFPNDERHERVPVVGWDMMVDLAVLGPITTDRSPLPVAEDDDLPLGSDVFLVGYPHGRAYPEIPEVVPSIVRGVLASTQQWEAQQLTYLLTDADTAGGQSGGVMTNPQGEALGLTGILIPDGSFAAAASMPDLMPLIEQIMAGESTDGLDRQPVSHPLTGTTTITTTLANPWDEHTFILWPEQDATTTLEWRVSDSEAADVSVFSALSFQIINPRGESPELESLTSQPVDARVKQRFQAEEGPYFVSIAGQNTRFLEAQFMKTLAMFLIGDEDLLAEEEEISWPITMTLRSTTPIQIFDDPDDRKTPLTSPTQTLRGTIDFPGDVDIYPFKMKAGDALYVKDESLLGIQVITWVAADDPNEVLAQEAWTDSPGILFWQGPELSVRAPEDGEYWLIVSIVDPQYYVMPNGYLITTSPYKDGDPTPVPKPSPTPISTQAGPMERFVRPYPPYVSFLYPNEWEHVSECTGEEDLYDYLDEGLVAIDCFEDDISGSGVYLIVGTEEALPVSLKKAENLIATSLLGKNRKLIARKKVTNASGLVWRLSHYRKWGLEWWIALTRNEGQPIALIYFMDPNDKETPWKGKIKTFESLVLTSLDSVRVEDKDPDFDAGP
jgi:S1-C subfamily serine protease